MHTNTPRAPRNEYEANAVIAQRLPTRLVGATPSAQHPLFPLANILAIAFVVVPYLAACALVRGIRRVQPSDLYYGFASLLLAAPLVFASWFIVEAALK